MPRWSARFCLCSLILALVAWPAAAEIFHVRLHNGTVLDTLYQPQQAAWDPNMVLILTDVGNWIGLPQNTIDAVDSDTQVRGFGVAINSATIAIGWAPNDAAEASQQQANAPSATELAIQQMLQQQQAQAHYTVPQGVQSEQTRGIPAGFIGGYNAAGSRYSQPSMLPLAPVTPAAPMAPSTLMVPATPPAPTAPAPLIPGPGA